MLRRKINTTPKNMSYCILKKVPFQGAANTISDIFKKVAKLTRERASIFAIPLQNTVLKFTIQKAAENVKKKTIRGLH
jgi:hypothetical protein